MIRKECATALSPSHLPGLDFALNPYTRCGHNCSYCYAPYVMRSPVSEWGTGIQAKMNIPQLLAKELPRKKGTIGLGTVTDPYQPVEREMRLTRRCLEVMTHLETSVSILTKSDLVSRDADLISRVHRAEVGITLNTLSDEKAAIFEPCAPPPSARLAAAKRLSSAGIRTYVFLGPVIPTITDVDLQGLVQAIKGTGVEHIMVDRLNLRPGMEARLVEIIEQKAPEQSARFKTEVGSAEYYRRTTAQIRRVAEESELACQDAF